MGPLYVVTGRFDASRGADWERYVAWSGLRQLTEVVSLDSILCPRVAGELRPEDRPHVVNEDCMLDFHLDLDHLLRRAGDLRGKNLLCVFRDPASEPAAPTTRPRFAFEGYDLVDVDGGVSVLGHCGGFPDAFANDELSPHGLLQSLPRANEVRARLAERYAGDGHERCHAWGIFRAEAP